MKRILFLLVGGVIFFVVGCGGGSGDSSNSTGNLDNKDFFVKAEPSSVVSADLVDVLDTHSSEMASDLNTMFSLPDRDITIIYKDCDVENAFYNPTESQVVMCYELLSTLLGGINTIDDALGIFEFIFWHEIGHAFIDQFQIAVLGSEEDAVDAISAVIMIANSDTPTEQVEAARGIILAGDYLNNSGAVNWADSHSVGPQRLRNLVCWAWGAEPSVTTELNIQDIVNELIVSGRDCRGEFLEKIKNVDTLIGKFTKG